MLTLFFHRHLQYRLPIVPGWRLYAFILSFGKTKGMISDLGRMDYMPYLMSNS